MLCTLASHQQGDLDSVRKGRSCLDGHARRLSMPSTKCPSVMQHIVKWAAMPEMAHVEGATSQPVKLLGLLGCQMSSSYAAPIEERPGARAGPCDSVPPSPQQFSAELACCMTPSSPVGGPVYTIACSHYPCCQESSTLAITASVWSWKSVIA